MKKNINYIITQTGITLMVGDRRESINKEDSRYADIISSIDNDEVSLEDFIEILDREVHTDYSSKGVEILGDTVKFNGTVLPPALSRKIIRFKTENLPFAAMEKFLERITKNTSYSSINELYDFLAAQELPITEDGCFIAYKGVQKDGYSVHGNKNTKVKNGQVDNEGRIYNFNWNEPIEVDRSQVDDNRDVYCSYGLHVGSPDYAFGFGEVTIKVKVDPADVVSVPSDCSFQKCRVCKYIPLGIVEKVIESAGTDEWGDAPIVREKSWEEEVREFNIELFRDFYFHLDGDSATINEFLDFVDENYWINANKEYSTTLKELQDITAIVDNHDDYDDDYDDYYEEVIETLESELEDYELRISLLEEIRSRSTIELLDALLSSKLWTLDMDLIDSEIKMFKVK